MRARGTNDPAATAIVAAVRDSIAEATGDELVGLYAYGSVITGDFEPDVSDVDLIAVLSEVPDDPLVERLRAMHERLAAADPAWDDRIEVDYVSRRGLAECRTHPSTIARISPGESFHVLEAGRDFILDWYPARQNAVALFGPSVDTLIPEISETEYLDEVRRYLSRFPDRFDEDASARSQSYAVLTMCRGLYVLRGGERLSKREAGRRARDEFPRWAAVIDEAIAWRDGASDDADDDTAAVREARAFLTDIARLLDLRDPE